MRGMTYKDTGPKMLLEIYLTKSASLATAKSIKVLLVYLSSYLLGKRILFACVMVMGINCLRRISSMELR